MTNNVVGLCIRYKPLQFQKIIKLRLKIETSRVT